MKCDRVLRSGPLYRTCGGEVEQVLSIGGAVVAERCTLCLDVRKPSGHWESDVRAEQAQIAAARRRCGVSANCSGNCAECEREELGA